MKKSIVFRGILSTLNTKIIFLFLCLTQSCTQASKSINSVRYPEENFKQANFPGYFYSLKFSEDYCPLDTNSKIISKTQFYKRILNNDLVPIKIDSNNRVYYKLVKANPTKNQMRLIQALVSRASIHYEMEGKTLPHFDFIDINGKEFSSKNTKGKILLLRFWFIGCRSCVEERPILNKIVDQYKDRQDILFISLAFDKKNSLKKFLENTSFKYAVIPNQGRYVMDSLQVTSFPTHAIINKKGEIVFRHEGGADYSNKEFQDYIVKLTKE